MKKIARIAAAFWLVFAAHSLTANAAELDDQLRNSAGNGDIATVRQLLAQGVNVNARNSSGMTALSYAATNCHTEVLKLLVAKGGKVNVFDKTGSTPLMRAASHCADGIGFLIEQGADLNAVDDRGETALMWAVSGYIGGYGDANNVRILIEKGADLNVKNKYGDTALSNTDIFARDADQEARITEIRQILKNAGAR